MKYSVTLSIVLAIAGTSWTIAADKPAPSSDQAKAFAEMQKNLIQQFDTNKDGALSAQEQLAAQEAMAKHGMLPLGMAPGGFPGSDMFLKQFDKDGNGQLNAQEQLAAQAAYQRMRGGSGIGQHKGHHGPRIGGFPSGGLGGMPALPAAGAGGASGNANGGNGSDKGNALIKRFDKDGDGKLNADEKAAAQAALKAKNKPQNAK